MNRNNHLPASEDSLAAYRPFLNEVSSILEKIGEAATLQMFARNPELADVLQSACRLAFLSSSDLPQLNPTTLAGMQKLGLEISYIVQLSFPPNERHQGYFDFSKNIPQRYLEYLLKQPYPFEAFWNDLCTIEIGRVCSFEIQRRGKNHPELDEIIDYKCQETGRGCLD